MALSCWVAFLLGSFRIVQVRHDILLYTVFCEASYPIRPNFIFTNSSLQVGVSPLAHSKSCSAILHYGTEKGETVHLSVLEVTINIHVEVFSFLNGNITRFHKIHEISIAGQHQDNLTRGDPASRFPDTDVKVGVMEGGSSIRKEIDERRPINLSNIVACSSEADDEGEMVSA